MTQKRSVLQHELIKPTSLHSLDFSLALLQFKLINETGINSKKCMLEIKESSAFSLDQASIKLLCSMFIP